MHVSASRVRRVDLFGAFTTSTSSQASLLRVRSTMLRRSRMTLAHTASICDLSSPMNDVSFRQLL